MVKNRMYRFLGSLALVCLLGALAPQTTFARPEQDVVLSIPAGTVLSSIRRVLPLTIPSHSRQLQGDIILESLEGLSIDNNIITVRGVLSGRDLMLNTKLAGQPLQLRVSQVHLPVTCNLFMRFEPGRHKLFVTPRFPNAQEGGGDNGSAALFGALDGREYQIDLDDLKDLQVNIGEKTVAIAMEPVRVAGANNILVLHMLPRVGSPQ